MIFRVNGYGKTYDIMIIDSGFSPMEAGSRIPILYGVRCVCGDSYEEFSENVSYQQMCSERILEKNGRSFQKLQCSEFAVIYKDNQFHIIKNRFGPNEGTIEPLEESW